MGNEFEEVTEAINEQASLRLARIARERGRPPFRLCSSSCSIYGAAEGGPRRESDPAQSAHRLCPIESRDGKRACGRTMMDGMTVTCLRFATACGMSDRLRLDLVLNDFVAGALATARSPCLSDGTPWRPLIDVADMARAIEWAIARRFSGGRRFCRQCRQQGRELSGSGAGRSRGSESVPATGLRINKAAPPDLRSYRVDFSLFAELAPEHQPVSTLTDSIDRLKTCLGGMGFSDKDFRTSSLMRLKTLKDLSRRGGCHPRCDGNETCQR